MTTLQLVNQALNRALVGQIINGREVKEVTLALDEPVVDELEVGFTDDTYNYFGLTGEAPAWTEVFSK